MYPEPSWYRTVDSASVKPVWSKIVQVYPYFIHFEPKYSYAPVRAQITLIQSVKIDIGHGISILTVSN